MRDIFPDIEEWLKQGRRLALATVVQTWGSAPRGVGSCMAVAFGTDESSDEQILVVGSVSGGCVETAVIDAAERVLQSGVPQMLDFGVADETAWNVGLSCGGRIRVFVEVFWGCSEDAATRELWQQFRAALLEKRAATLLTWTQPSAYRHQLIQDIDERIERIENSTAYPAYSVETEIDGEPVFVRVLDTPAQLVIVGAGHIAVHLVRFARELDFETIVIDPRGVFADVERFRGAQPDRLLNAWADEALPALALGENVFAVTLTHDPKIDEPALQYFLNTPATSMRYIGALGSAKTHEKRTARLREAAFSDEQIARIHAPVGLSIGAQTPAEIALSIVAEITHTRRKKTA